MYHHFVCAVQLGLMRIQERRRIDKLYGMVASMSADLISSMPMHLSEESEPVQFTQPDADVESQGKKWIYSFR